mmetsp:Transcript_7468/g.21093  ORF Transcript_7468/g.21093 Transcript_7468/m.21093 type:complete len:380 (+) Transcript_7468:501-1640(+)|eukprot:CAMPEP_0117666514 /NCGR_PEP_ID=MMETSP0804-20121206/10420_1 /TAXON_ID=1074897 /ORGANISM="Tetraselmis astigmatica, Strain CCMP880" /LENGTH=379 /DNA_ID=CAMNT_0005474071 /DNA_START=466 /DNA_END=1605 /DNA_ORIENTATION=+
MVASSTVLETPVAMDVFPQSKPSSMGPSQGLRSLVVGLPGGALPANDDLSFSGKRGMLFDRVYVDGDGKRTRGALHDITNSELSDEDTSDVVVTPKQASGPVCIIDIDAPKRNDPQSCTSYVCDIYRNLRASECKRRPSSWYLEQVQRDVNACMRGILVDWMVEVAEEYHMVPETLYLSVNYLDRVLSVLPIPQKKLQLVGVSCLMLASKYEEIFPQSLDEFSYITDRLYSKQDIKECEMEVLRTLKYELTVPTIRPFLKRCLQAAKGGSKLEFLANYICELALLDYGMLQFLPSMIAASSVILAQITLNLPVWSSTLSYYSGYSKQELRDCARALHKLFSNAKKSGITAVSDKYAMHRYKCVSNISTNYSSLPEHLFC